ncbi:hypothetical protein [Xanthomarina spongicola]|uniref:Uncharacterized protein n=1 Tax=Xanthomarina spongicola TaxID=570520 RepID=A0A316DHN6_9FLAO|nr:hypothetical protein [Xanthomarina spongicola]PWK17654.1 hypothetical protein LX78_02445 [Xanthomarina spongicola]
MSKKLVLTCLINFFVAALMGLALRYTYISPISINYRFLTHAHSHVAMLGWVYLMLYTLYFHYFVPNKKPVYISLFWITQVSVIGMMISFPIQGYAAISITFSTLHIFCSYYFFRLIWKNLKTDSKVSKLLLKTSLLFMLTSTIGVWCLGPAVGLLGQASAFYQIAIQFFLHFQFNGWFLVAVLAILFHKLQIKDSKEFRLFFKLLIASILFTFALPVNWFAPHNSLLWINGFGVLLQIAALYLFIKLIKSSLKNVLKTSSKIIQFMLYFALFSFVLKIGLQTLSLIPEVSNVAYQHRNLVIGFIHLTMLGVISGFLLAYILQSKLVTFNKSLSISMYVFVLGFILTELILLLQGGLFYFGNGLLPNYYILLFISSILLPAGIIGLTFNIIKTKII